MASRPRKTFQTTFGSVPHEKESGQDNTSKNVNTKGSEASRLNQETKVEQRDETDDASSDYKTLLQEIRLAAGKGFQDLKEQCASLKLPALQMAEEEEFLWDELQPDGTSQKLLPPDKGSRYSALKTTADGNCFFRTASILAFGNEHKHDEMRVRIVIELACNSDFYLKDKDIEKMLIAEAQELEADEAPDLHSSRGRPTSTLGPEALRGIFETEVRRTTRDKIWACHWHLQALAAVLNRQVLSVYPECGGKEIKKYLNIVILPRCCDEKIKMKKPVALMWTQANRSSPFKPDHFVPLIPVDKIPCNRTNNPPPWKRNDNPLPSEEEYLSLSNQNGPPSVPSKGPICEENGNAGKVSVHAGSLVKQIISEDPFVLDEVCLKLDYPVKKARCGYWPHFAHLLGASEETKKRCQNRSNYKPSLMMFTYLSTTSPGFTVNGLEFYLGKIEKGNLVSMLKQSCVKGTERLTVLSQRDWKTFHAICLDLDCSNIYNWQDLGTQIGISLEIFEKCKRPEECADLALQIIATRQPYLSVGKMKDVLSEMGRRDVFEQLNELPDGSDIKTLLESYDVLQKVTRLLEKETPQNWQVFAQKFGVSKEECDYLCPEDCHSPTEALMEYLSAADENLTLQTFIQALLYIPREDVVESLKKFFHPIDIDHIVDSIRSGTAERTNPSKLIQVLPGSDIL